MLLRLSLAASLVLLSVSSAFAQDATSAEIAARLVQRPLASGAAVPTAATARPASGTPAEKLPQRQATPLPQAVLVPGGKFNPPPQKSYAWRYKAEDAPVLAVVWSVPAAAPIYFAPGTLATKESRPIAEKMPALRPLEPKIAPTANPVETPAFDYVILRANTALPPTPFSPVVVPDPFKNVREIQLRQPPADLEGPAWVAASPEKIKLP